MIAIWPIISLVYSVVLLCATGKDGSLFSIITSLCMYWIVGKVMRGVCKFQILPAAIAALFSLANFVLSCIITKSENESISLSYIMGTDVAVNFMDIIVIVLSIILIIVSFVLKSDKEMPKLKCHVFFPLLFMMLSFLIGHSLFHIVMVLGFSFLFCKWAISRSAVKYITKSQSTCYSIFILLDYAIWSSSSLWVKYLPIDLSSSLSPSSTIWSKVCSVLAYACINIITEITEDSQSHTVKSKTRLQFESQIRVIKTFFYHFVNSPVGLFVQNGLIILWVFMYPSIFSVILLILSTINVVNVKSEKMDEAILISPRIWSQNLLIIYGLLMGIVYYCLTSNLATSLQSYREVYYLLLGGLTSFKYVNWFIYIFLFFLGWVSMMSRNLDKKKCCYPKYLTVPSPSKSYKVIRVIFLIACLLTCLISPDLTMGILLILFLFANFANIWSFQICYSALISVVKIVVCLLNDDTTTNDIFELFGLRGGRNPSVMEPVNVYNFYSIVNGIILILATFNYLAILYEKQENLVIQKEQTKQSSVWKNSVWILYLISYFTFCLGVPSYLAAISLLFLSFVVMTHLLGHERKGMWYLDVVIEILVFAYAYLNMFTLLSQYIYPESFLSNYQITRVEVGLFVSSDIVTSVSKGDFFFYLLPFFIRIVIAASRILSLNKKEKQEEVKPEEEKLKDYYTFSTLFKLFIYNHFPKLLLTVVVVISFIEKDVMSYILFFFFLCNAFITISRHPRWNGAFRYYILPVTLIILCRYVSQYSWNYRMDSTSNLHMILQLLGFKRYIQSDLAVPTESLSFFSSQYWKFTLGNFRSIFYYVAILAICGLNYIVDKMGVRLVNKLQELETKAQEENTLQEEHHCRIKEIKDYDEVYRLSTIITRGIYIMRKEGIAAAVKKYEEDKIVTPSTEEEEEKVEEESEEETEVEETEEYSDVEQPSETLPTPTELKPKIHVKKPFMLRLFNKYSDKHDIPTTHIFWLHVKKNLYLFLYELIAFFNHNLLDVIRLINIGMMTLACGTDNVDSLLNILLIIGMTVNLKSYTAAPRIAGILCVLLFLEYALYIFPDRELLKEFLHMENMNKQVVNYLMIADISSKYMIPNTITMVCCIIQHQVFKERKQSTEQSTEQEMEMKETTKSTQIEEGNLTVSTHQYRPSAMSIIKEVCTLQLHNIMLIVIFLASVANTNLLNLVYLLFSLFYLFHPNSIKQVNSKPVKYIKWYAYIHLLIMVLYQIPFIPEPSQCEYANSCFAWHQFIGLNKMVYLSYTGNPICQLESLIDPELDHYTNCPHPLSIDGGVLNIVIINIIVNINYLVQSSDYYSIVAKKDHEEEEQRQANFEGLMKIWEKRLNLREKEVNTITSLLYNQLCIILNKVLFVDRQLHANKDEKFILPPTICSVTPSSPYSATIEIETNKMSWPIEESIAGFIVGICKERSDDLPNMNHVDLEVYYPNNEIIHDHHVILEVRQLLPNTSYKFKVSTLFGQGRTSPATTEKAIQTPVIEGIDTYLWSPVRVKINKYVYDNVQQMQKIEGFHAIEPQIDLDELEYHKNESRVREFGSSCITDVEKKEVSHPKVTYIPITNAEMKELVACDLLINTQTRELLLRKKSKEIGKYELCRVVNARYFPDNEDSDRDYLRLIVQWDTLKEDYIYIFRNKDHSKGHSIYQLIEWFNLVLPNPVYVNTREMEAQALDKRTSKKGSKLFNIPDIEYSKQWQHWLTIQKIFTVLLFVYVAIRGDIFSILLAMFYLCYASLFSLHIPYSFFNISSVALTIIVACKFIFNTSIFVQYVNDGSWIVNLFTRKDGQVTNYPPDSFQILYLIGFYKNDSTHESPFMSSLIWDLLFILLLNYCKSKLRSFNLDKKSADDVLLEEQQKHIEVVKEVKDKTDVVDPSMPVQDLIRKEVDPEQLRFNHYSPTIQNFLLKMFPDMYIFRDSKSITHPYKYGHDYYLTTLIMQLILFIYIFLFYGDMTEMNYAFSKSVSSGTIQSGTVWWICILFIMIVLERIMFVKRMLRTKYCIHLITAIAVHIYCFFIVPVHTQTHILSNGYLIFFYIFFMLYIWTSVKQIRSGYPTKDQYIQKCVVNDYGMVAYFSNMIYRYIPFLYEMNCLIDWSVSETACDLWNYMRIEEIKNTMFVAKYKSLGAQKDTQRNRGEARGTSEKIMWGFSLIFVIVLLLLLPLILFSSDSSALVSNPVKSMSLNLNLIVAGEPLPIYTFTNSGTVESVSRDEYGTWQNMYKTNTGKTMLLPKWSTESQKIEVPSISNQPWNILEEYADRIVEIVSHNCSSVQFEMTYQFHRDMPSGGETVSHTKVVTFNETQCQSLIDLFNLNNHENPNIHPEPIVFEHFYPRLFYLTDSTSPDTFDTDEEKYNSIAISLNSTYSSVFNMNQFYWIVYSDNPYQPQQYEKGVTFWVINETVLSQLLASGISSLGSASITGLYVIILMTVGTYFRSFLVPGIATIAYVTMPDPLPILELICGLYITRIDTYKGHLRDESKIAAMIISIIRSNELMLQLSTVQPLYGVLQMKDELYNSVNTYMNEDEDSTSLLPLISYVIKNMQIL